jgi:hypothetical protein
LCATIEMWDAGQSAGLKQKTIAYIWYMYLKHPLDVHVNMTHKLTGGSKIPECGKSCK